MDGCLFRALLCLFMLPGLANAESVNAEWLSSTRALSMGNVGIASAEEASTAAFYNPAALSRSKKAAVEFFNPQIDIGTGVFSTSNSIADWGKHASFSGSQPLVKAKAGSVSSIGISLFPNITSQNFSFGVLARFHRWAYYDNAAKSWNYQSRYLLIPSMGISLPIAGHRFRLGAAVRAIQITETNGVVPDTGSTASLSQVTGEGLRIGLAAGFLPTLPWAWRPTIGGLARKGGDTAFPTRGFIKWGGGEKVNREKIKMTYDAGFSVAPKVNQRDVLTMAFDFRDALNQTKTQYLRHVNAGLEYAVRKKLFIRGGISQGYWTAGFGLAAKTGSLDIGTYADELHQSGYNIVEDRRISIRFTRRF